MGERRQLLSIFTSLFRAGAAQLLAVAPHLRGRDADAVVATLISEDAQAAGPGQTASDRSSRRLFERLVALGGACQLTGRSTFRLYGL